MPVEICFQEKMAPQAVVWAEEAVSRGGLAVPDVPQALIQMKRKYGNLRDFTSNNDILEYGAWVDDCLAEFAFMILEIYHAKSLTIDLRKSVAKIERQGDPMWVSQTLNTSQREDLLFEKEERLKDFSGRLFIQK